MGQARSLVEYVDALASTEPTPGGGSASATTGSFGAALGAMVSRLGAQRTKSAADSAALENAIERLNTARRSLLELALTDEQAFAAYQDARSLPGSSSHEQSARQQAIQDATINAALVPLDIVRSCTSALDGMQTAARLGSRYALTDVRVGSLLLVAAAESAAALVRTNTDLLNDPERARSIESDLDEQLHSIQMRRSVIEATLEDR